jgi:hypothetical protein
MTSIDRPAFRILIAICFCHLINDMLQSLSWLRTRRSRPSFT